MAKSVDIVLDILIYYSMSENARHSWDVDLGT